MTVGKPTELEYNMVSGSKPQKERKFMGIASKYNHGVKFNVQIPEDTPFVSLADLFNNNGAGMVYLLRALFINKKSHYGDAPVAVVGDGSEMFRVNLPKFMLDTVNDMLHDEEFVNAVNAKAIGFNIYPYDKDGRTCFSVSWLDVEV